ncbi:hypothetical protein ACTWP5_15775 [Streptomyces sp. 4N509B]|uniref:hypothetical protein n=1 Tax=Streptomyces sp. 4N509B TaxID=3457413 RepID=UPI003FD68205
MTTAHATPPPPPAASPASELRHPPSPDGASPSAGAEEAHRAERVRRARARANAVTYVVASIATAAALLGMWPVTRAAVVAAGIPAELVTPVALTVLGLLEGTIVACGIRARANVLETGATGVDGIGLWVAVGASALISATEAAVAAPPGTSTGQQLVTVLVRLAAPVVAGWLWERGLAPERRTARDIRLREPLRTRQRRHGDDAVPNRRATIRAARLADRLVTADEERLTPRQRWVLRRLRHALRASGAAHDATVRRFLLADLALSRNAFSLSRVRPPSPWELTTERRKPDADELPRHVHPLINVRRAHVPPPAAPETSPENGPESSLESAGSVRLPSGREAFSAGELDIARRLFEEFAERFGREPSVNAVGKAISRRWARAKRVHAAVRAERAA